MIIRELNETLVKEKNILVLVTADVVTSYGNIHYVITEYDVFPLFENVLRKKHRSYLKFLI